MRATILFDPDGQILAAAIHNEDDDSGPRPMARGDAEVADFDIPEELQRGRSPDEVFGSLRVDVGRRLLVRDGDDGSSTSA